MTLNFAKASKQSRNWFRYRLALVGATFKLDLKYMCLYSYSSLEFKYPKTNWGALLSQFLIVSEIQRQSAIFV